MEAEIGTRLPSDYKLLVETYGSGEFCDFLYLRTPYGTSQYNGVQWQSAPLGSRESHPGRYPHPLHPDPGALLIWGATMDADRLCWLTDKAPEQWPVVVWSRDGQYETHRMGAADFIQSWADGHLGTSVLPEMEPELAPWFNAFRPRTRRCLRLTEGAFSYPERSRILRAALAPCADRGSWRSADAAMGQDHFATVDTDWLLTYNGSQPHHIRIDFPPEDGKLVQQRLFAAVHLMGCEIIEITTVAGVPLLTWESAADDE